LAINAATGQIVGHFQALADDTFSPSNPAGADLDFGASPNLLQAPNGQALVGEGNKNGTYYALDPTTLTPLWSTLIAPGSPILGGITGSTAYDGTRVYGSDVIDSEIWALGRDGSRQWVSADTGTLDFSPLAVAHGVLYTADAAGFLTARNASTGAVLATFPVGAPTFGGISVVGGAIYVAVGTGPPPGSSQDGSGSILAFGDTSRAGPPGKPTPARASIRLSVQPRSARTGSPTRFRFHAATSGPHPRAVAGAIIIFDGRRAPTNRRGDATITVSLRHAGAYRARARKAGFLDGRATVHASRAPRAPSFTG
jgi:outer membrane protein assembly factor BamB